MLDQKLRLDIRVVKFQDYIRRKPESPFGYYGLGIQYMLSEKYSMADRMFQHALKINPHYMPAKIGRLEFLLYEKKYVSAARYYYKNKSAFQKKTLYTTRVQRITSRLYYNKGFSLYMKKIRSRFVFKEGIGILQRMFNNGPDNPIVNLLLSMFFLKEGIDNEKAFVLYNICVTMKGIEDGLRWDLIKALSKEQPDILHNEHIAGLFSSIPEGALDNGYANILLNHFITLQDKERVTGAFLALQKRHIYPDVKTLWQYLVFCRNNNIWDNMLFLCCRKLIDSGWIDKVVAATIRELKIKNIAESTRDLDKILLLYGYT